MLLLAFVATALAQGALPSTIVTTCGYFFGTVGGGASVRYCGSNCDQAGAPSGGIPCPPQPGDAIDSQVRWGQSVTSGNPYAQSGMGFTGEKNKEVPLNREWFCGRLTHFNFPIIGPALSTRLGLTLRIPEFSVNSNFDFLLNIDETTNSDLNSPCPYPSTVPCSDKITFDLAGLDFKKKFKIGLVDYTLQLTGFKESRVSTSFPTENFISNENRENNAFLFARIVAACPDTCTKGGGKVELILDSQGLKTCGCNCGANTCVAPKVQQKDCSCACPPGTCNGAPTDANCNCNCPSPESAMLTCTGDKSGWDTAKCACKCPDGFCGGGLLVDPTSCRCDCASVTCTNGRVANPKNKCQCECLAECGPKQKKVTDGGKCECQCDPAQTQCAAGFKLEIDPTSPTSCRCGCANVCGAGCGAAGSVKQCSDGPNEPCCQSCQFQPLPCNDNNKCTKDDKCDPIASLMAGRSVCKGVPVCPTPADTCTTFTCNPLSGNCEKSVAMDGAACGPTGSSPETWDRCQFECRGGQCVGKTVTCDMTGMMVADGKDCTGYLCNPKSGVCEAGPKPGKPCNDGNLCTLNDVCKQVGADVVCQGELNDCSAEKAPTCHKLKCDPRLGLCEKVPVAYGEACAGDGTDACKTSGICSGGVCLFKRKCPDLPKEEALCNDNVCDKMSGQCTVAPRAVGSACILPNGRPRDTDFCGSNYACALNATSGQAICVGEIVEERKNHSECNGGVVVGTGDGSNAALAVGLGTLGALIFMIIIAVLLCMFINKSKLTDPSTWGMGADVAVQNSPMYDQSAGGQQNRLYEGR